MNESAVCLNVVTFGKVFKLMHVTVVALYSIYLIAIGECESNFFLFYSHPLCLTLQDNSKYKWDHGMCDGGIYACMYKRKMAEMLLC